MTTLAWISLFLAAIPCLLFLFNLRAYRRTASAPSEPAAEKISVLIPARNEEHNLPGTLRSILENDAADFEVLVLDDHSTDRTAEIVAEFSRDDSRVRLASAPPLPAGWSGKNFACQTLAQLARNPNLVFVDADVRLSSDALRRINRFLQTTGASLASGVPRQALGTFSDHLLIPLIHFVLLGFLPMARMRRTRDPAYGAACGQLIAMRADDYRRAGGHAAIAPSIHDGLDLTRAFRKAGFATDLFDATDVATCRMYHRNHEVWSGLAKNATAGLGAPKLILPTTVLLLGGQVLPFVLLGAGIAQSSTLNLVALLAALMALAPRIFAKIRFQQSWTSALLHPLGIASLVGIQWFALIRAAANRPAIWKGRAYSPSIRVETS